MHGTMIWINPVQEKVTVNGVRPNYPFFTKADICLLVIHILNPDHISGSRIGIEDKDRESVLRAELLLAINPKSRKYEFGTFTSG